MDGDHDWNRERRLEIEALDRLRKACFEISPGERFWGTGFFFAPGLAFTADHNVRSAAREEFDGYFGDHPLRLRWVREWSSPEADIAVLHLVENLHDVSFELLPVRSLGPLIPAHELEGIWARRKVAVYGFPVHGAGQKETHIFGYIDEVEPLIWSDEKDDSGEAVEVRVRRLNIRGNKWGADIGGISGAPVYSLDWSCVIGVEGSCSPDGHSVLGSAIYELLGRLRAQRVDCTELFRHVPALTGDASELSSGVAVVVRDRGKPGLQTIPVALQFGPAREPGAAVHPDNPALTDLARSAVGWAGEYLRRFQGALERVIAENHWGTDKPFNFAHFSFPAGDYAPLAPVHAGMALAYILKVLRDTLMHDLKLPAPFSNERILCAAGFDGRLAGISGTMNIAAAVQHCAVSGPLRVLYARSQESELRALDIADLRQLSLVPIDSPEDIPRVVLGMFLDEIGTDRVKQHFRGLFTAALEERIRQEDALRDAQLSLQGREAQLSDMHCQILVGEKVQSHLGTLIAELKSREQASQELPAISRVLEELDRLQDRWEAEVGLIVLVDTSDQDYLRQCHRFYRHLATYVHDDHLLVRGEPPGSTLPRALQFRTLSAHKQDLLYLQAMEGALDPFGAGFLAPEIEDSVSRAVNRFFLLHEIYNNLNITTDNLRSEAASYGDNWKSRLDEGLEEARQALRAQDYQIDALWWELRWHLGAEAPDFH